MFTRKSSSGFKVQGSGFRVRGSNLEPGTRNSELGTGNSERRKTAGLSLVELIVFIVIVGVAVAGVLMALSVATRSSTDPMIQKQALAIAEAVLEEVQLQPFTYCDPDDPNAATANDSTGCASTAEAMGPETGETRAGASPFDNVNDYSGFSMTGGITDLAGNPIAGLNAYAVIVGVSGRALGPGVTPPTNIPSTESLLVTVTVTGPGNTTVVLNGYRVRYAPNALP